MTNRLLIQVIKVPTDSVAAEQPRDLLPWADPYVAAVIRRVQNQFAAHPGERRPGQEEAPPQPVHDGEDFTASDMPPEEASLHLDPAADDDCEATAFAPDRPRVLPFRKPFPPLFGGFPLLDDLPPEDNN